MRTVTFDNRVRRPKEIAMQDRIRRVRIKRPVTSIVPASDKVQMQDLVQSIAMIDRDVERMIEERKLKIARLLKLMQVYKQVSVEVEGAVAERYTPMGRAVSRIDPVAFAERTSEDDFFECIEVVRKRAEKVLAGKELDDITDTTPGKPGEETVKVTRR